MEKQIYGSDVFDPAKIKEAIGVDAFHKFEKFIDGDEELDEATAEILADAFKEWAIAKGATRFTHWFQPMTGMTAEKHDAFLEFAGIKSDIASFSAKSLIKGEPDASSFPSGGLRSTFEARGYTAWDPTSYAFVRDHILYIPTTFCSYDGAALDKKTPLLRSMDVLNKQALRVLRLLGDNQTKKVMPMVGPEQEYFLIDKSLYAKRKDLIYTGRTLLGALPPKSQELANHYFGSIKPRVQAFMDDVNLQLWHLGIPAKTEHNEAAPSQYELTPVFEIANLAADHNQLIMDVLRKTAEKHDFVCLLNEKPFAGINGSGKHNNWSLATDEGENLFALGKDSAHHWRFFLFLAAVIKAVDECQGLIRASVASSSNDRRLGGDEAPPSIVSVFLGEVLTSVLQTIKEGKDISSFEKAIADLISGPLSSFNKDASDRNRTSPVAFTGNKFEFRMLGSSDSIACLNVMINSAVAYSLKTFADELEGSSDIRKDVYALLRREIIAHERIIFNGNAYGEGWAKEAKKRGLPLYQNTPESIACLIEKKNVDMLTSLRVYSERELHSRYRILLEIYCKTIMIEAKTLAELAYKEILPSISGYIAKLGASIQAKAVLLLPSGCYETSIIDSLSKVGEETFKHAQELDDLIRINEGEPFDIQKDVIPHNVLPIMERLRFACDEAEKLVARECWPMPSYGDLLFHI